MFGAVGQPRPRRVDRGHPRRARRRHQLHRHRRRLLGRRVRGDRRPRRSPAGATTSCSRRSSSRRWAPTATWRAARAAGSCASARTACAGSAPTTSTSTRCTGPIPNVDIDETLGALSDLVHQGKVRYLGSSTFPASAIVEAQWVAERRNRERFVCEQPPYSILVRGIEADVLPTCQRYGMGVIPWSPLAGGWLSGKWRTGGDRSHQPPGQPRPGALRPRRAREPAEARGGRRARPAGRRGRHPARAPRGRVGAAQPGGDLGDHRPPHDGAAHHAARRGRRRPRRPTCSTASTRSCRRARTSAGPTPATRRR